MTDYTFEDHGSIWLLQPHNPAAAEHLADHVGVDSGWLGTALAVEPRYVLQLAGQLRDAGFEVAL